jgi:hypothetical protein
MLTDSNVLFKPRFSMHKLGLLVSCHVRRRIPDPGLQTVTEQTALVAGLCRPEAYPHPVDLVEHLETHISHVFLAGDYAYKVKKDIALGFLDFSTLERRRFYCGEEIRLNRRLAPQVCLDVVPVTGDPARPRMGGEGEPLEYAVKMRRFDQDGLLTRLPLSLDLAERLAQRVAVFHQQIPAAGPADAYGSPEAVLAPMQVNVDEIRGCSDDPRILDRAASPSPGPGSNTPSITQQWKCGCSLRAEPKRCTKLTAPSRAFSALSGACSRSACSTIRRKMFNTAVTALRSCRRKYRRRLGSDNTH